MYYTQTYRVDWNKIKTTKDIITILKNLEIRVDIPCKDFKKLAIKIDKLTERAVK